MGIGSIFQKNRPAGFLGKGDKYLPKFIEELSKILFKEMQEFVYDTLKLPKNKVTELAVHIIEFAEDIHNDIGLWRSYEAYNTEYFGLPLPLYAATAAELKENEYHIDRISHFLSILYEELLPDLILAPTHEDIECLAKIIARFLSANMQNIPKDSGIRKFLLQPVVEASDVKKKLVWLGINSYLFRVSFINYANTLKLGQSIPVMDDFICQQNTRLSGLGVIDILAAVLDITDNRKQLIRSWYERYAAFYKVLSAADTTIEVLNLINDKPYLVNTGRHTSVFKIDHVILGSLVPWDNGWYWSGEQKTWGVLQQDAIDDIKSEFIKNSPHIVYRYDGESALKAREGIKKHRTDFIKYFGNDLVIFASGEEMAARLQEKMASEYKAKMQPDELLAFMKKYNLKHPAPNYELPDSFRESANGVGVYFNPDEGMEIALEFYTLINGFKKQGVNLSDDEKNTIRLFIESSALSPGFVKRMTAEYGNQSVLSSFLILSCNDEEICLEYLLRKYKGHFYRNRYPSLSIID